MSLRRVSGAHSSDARIEQHASKLCVYGINIDERVREMKIGAVTTGILQFEVEEGLDFLRDIGIGAIEIGTAGFQSRKYGDPDALLADHGQLDRWLDGFQRRDLEISAFSVHGEPLSPNPDIAEEYDRQFRQSCRLAQAAGVKRLTLLAGLPEGAPGDNAPCWVTVGWPRYNQDIRRWQWEERVIPYWREHAKIAEDHGCHLCFEMHPSDVVYNPETLLWLRSEIGDVIGCNFDPSHLFWQGIDALEALHSLADAVYHVHAKDARIQERNVRVNGVLDTKPFARLAERSWVFRTVGYGHDVLFWRDFVTTLRTIGYDDVLSIEHDDDYVDPQEGLEKAFGLLKEIVLEKPPGVAWWATQT